LISLSRKQMQKKDDVFLNLEVDFGVLTAKEIRDVLKSKAHCLRAGFPPNHVIIQTLNEFRDHYVKKVGLPTYLSQMLGDVGKAQMQYCKLYRENGSEIQVQLNGSHNQPVQRFIARCFSVDALPFMIEVRYNEGDSDKETTIVRYL